jgi:hypothetical protein
MFVNYNVSGHSDNNKSDNNNNGSNSDNNHFSNFLLSSIYSNNQSIDQRSAVMNYITEILK